MTKYILAIAAGTAGAYFLAEPVHGFLNKQGSAVSAKIGDKLTLALATGGVGAAVACVIVR